MPKCKNCGEEITKFDKDICPYCGTKEPFDFASYETQDITQIFDVVEDNKTNETKVFHKRNIAFILCIIFGIFGLDDFYLGFIKRGLFRIIINILIFLLVSIPLFLLTKLSYFSFLIGFSLIFIIYFAYSFYLLFNSNIKDKNGVFLK